MKSFYSKTFAKYSPFFPILMIVLLVYGYLLRQDIALPTSMSSQQIDFWGRFGYSQTFLLENASTFFFLEIHQYILPYIWLSYIVCREITKLSAVRI
jgi:hypothetical protein